MQLLTIAAIATTLISAVTAAPYRPGRPGRPFRPFPRTNGTDAGHSNNTLPSAPPFPSRPVPLPVPNNGTTPTNGTVPVIDGSCHPGEYRCSADATGWEVCSILGHWVTAGECTGTTCQPNGPHNVPYCV